MIPVLLYGSETRVISAANMSKLSSFHHRCARFNSNRRIKPNDDGTWTYPSSKTMLEDAGQFSIETSTQMKRDMILSFVRNHPSDIEETDVVAGSEKQYWWKQQFILPNT